MPEELLLMRQLYADDEIHGGGRDVQTSDGDSIGAGDWPHRPPVSLKRDISSNPDQHSTLKEFMNNDRGF